MFKTGNCEGDSSLGVISLARSVGNGRIFDSLGQKIRVPGDTTKADLKVLLFNTDAERVIQTYSREASPNTANDFLCSFFLQRASPNPFGVSPNFDLIRGINGVIDDGSFALHLCRMGGRRLPSSCDLREVVLNACSTSSDLCFWKALERKISE